jgi:hypothetical protein
MQTFLHSKENFYYKFFVKINRVFCANIKTLFSLFIIRIFVCQTLFQTLSNKVEVKLILRSLSTDSIRITFFEDL